MRIVPSSQLQVFGTQNSRRSRSSNVSHCSEDRWSWASPGSRNSEKSARSCPSYNGLQASQSSAPRKTWSWLPALASGHVAKGLIGSEQSPKAFGTRSALFMGTRRMSLAHASAAIKEAEPSNAWAALFNIRVGVPEGQQWRLLDARQCAFPDEDLLAQQDILQTICSLLVGRSVAQFLKLLTVLSMFFAPLPLAVEPRCELAVERHAALGMKAVHMAQSIVYAVLSSSRWWVTGVILPYRSRDRGVNRWHLYLDIASLGGLIAEFVLMESQPGTAAHSWARIVWLLHVLKAWRVLRPTALTSAELRGLTLQIITLFFELVLAAHSFACAFLALANYEAHRGLSTWMDPLLVRGGQQSCVDLYMAALYFSTYTLTSIGYGDLVPANVLEHMACVVFMLGSQMFAAKIFADLTWITTTHKYWTTQHHTRLTQTATALESIGVHPDLYERVMAYQDFIEQQQKERRAQEILRDLSRPLREEMGLVVHYDLVSQATFLQAQPTFLVRHIISALNDVVYLPCDVIIRDGDVGDELFFLRSGRAGVFTSSAMPAWDDVEVLVLRNGAYFGEVAILTGQPRSSWVIARTYCICSVLSKHVIDNIMADHPSCIAGLVSSLKSVLKLKPATTWKEISKRIQGEFDDEASGSPEDQVFEFACSGEDGEAPAGLITWARFNVLMQRLHICALDRKLFWVELDHNHEGAVTFAHFWDTLQEFNDDMPSAGTGATEGDTPSPISEMSLPTLMGNTGSFMSMSKPCKSSRSSTSWAGTGELWPRFGSLHASSGSASMVSLGSSAASVRRATRRKSSMLGRGLQSSDTGAAPPTVVLHGACDAPMPASQERMHSEVLAQLASLAHQVRQLTAHLGVADCSSNN